MRILNLDAPFLVPAFRAAGHEVFSIGLHSSCDQVVSHPLHAFELWEQLTAQAFVADAVFCCDSGNLPYFLAVESLPCPSAYYSIDTYYNPWHLGVAYAYDYIFVAQREHVPLFSSQNMPAEWLPLFAAIPAPSACPPVRDIPVAFVGSLTPKNIPDRKPFLDAFRRLHPLFVTSGPYVDIFSRSQIVLNQTAASEINFRCFEAMACGAALLMEHSPHGLESLFTPGDTILPLYTRGDAAQAAAIARKALRQPQALADIAARGQECVARHHSDSQRAQRVLHILTDLVRHKAHSKRLAELPRREKHIGSAYAMLFDELNSPELQTHKEFFLRISAHYMPATLLTTDTKIPCTI